MRSQKGASASAVPRASLPFRSVNRKDRPGYDPALQRHHLLPRQLLTMQAFATMFETLGKRAIGFEDFRRNGLLLPARDPAVIRLGLPLHRGPHRHYNEMVIERVGEVELAWQRMRRRSSSRAGEQALRQLVTLQNHLRNQLLNPEDKPLKLNRRDPLGEGFDFYELDAMANKLWVATQAVASANAAFAC